MPVEPAVDGTGELSPAARVGGVAGDERDLVRTLARLAELHEESAAILRRLIETGLADPAATGLMEPVPVDVQPPAPERLMRVRDLAALLQITPRAVRRMRSSGRLPPAIDVGGSVVRWRPEIFNAWLLEREGRR